MNEEFEKDLKELDNDPLIPKKEVKKVESYNSLNNKTAKKSEVKEKRVITQIAKGTEKKKSGLSKFAEDINLKENSKEVGTYVLRDVVAPAIKDTIVRLVTGSINILFYGNAGGNGKSNNSVYGKSNYTPYNSLSTNKAPMQQNTTSAVLKRTLNYETRKEAEDILAAMNDLILDYGQCSVSEMCELSGITPEYTDARYGWVDLSTARVSYGRDGFYIELPRAKVI